MGESNARMDSVQKSCHLARDLRVFRENRGGTGKERIRMRENEKCRLRNDLPGMRIWYYRGQRSRESGREECKNVV